MLFSIYYQEDPRIIFSYFLYISSSVGNGSTYDILCAELSKQFLRIYPNDTMVLGKQGRLFLL